MSTPALIADKLVKLFPGVCTLDGASLCVEPGSVHALLGENGAGKSTKIKILTGVYRPDGGRLEVAGREASQSSPHAAAQAGVGDPDRPMRRLPVSQLQLIEVAKALSMDSRVSLLEKPTTASTPREVDRLFEVIRKLRDDGIAVLFLSPKLEEVYEICNTVTVLRDGVSVVESVPLAELGREKLIASMVSREHAAIELPERLAAEREPVLELDSDNTPDGHRDVSFALRRGAILGLYGLVGAGRTELAKALLGLSPITGSEVQVRGKAVRIRNVRDGLRAHRICVPEYRKAEGLFLKQPITRGIAVAVWHRIARRFGGVSARRESALAEDYRQRLGIRLASTDQLVGQLSGGNPQKVSLVKCTARSC
jgi:ribose transport system ATP-binding protein